MSVGFCTQGQPRLVTGDLKELRWATYMGVYINYPSYKVDLTKQVHQIVDKLKTNWYGINNTKRCVFKIDNLPISELNTVAAEYDAIFKLLEEIKADVLYKIKPLGKNVTLQK